MMINCTARGCMKQSEAKLNKDTGEVICMECGNPITNVTEYTKRTLLTQGQILRTTEKKPFQVHCPTCSAKRDVELIDGGKGGGRCAVCKADLRLSAAFLHALKVREQEPAGE